MVEKVKINFGDNRTYNLKDTNITIIIRTVDNWITELCQVMDVTIENAQGDLYKRSIQFTDNDPRVIPLYFSEIIECYLIEKGE